MYVRKSKGGWKQRVGIMIVFGAFWTWRFKDLFTVLVPHDSISVSALFHLRTTHSLGWVNFMTSSMINFHYWFFSLIFLFYIFFPNFSLPHHYSLFQFTFHSIDSCSDVFETVFKMWIRSIQFHFNLYNNQAWSPSATTQS